MFCTIRWHARSFRVLWFHSLFQVILSLQQKYRISEGAQDVLLHLYLKKHDLQILYVTEFENSTPSFFDLLYKKIGWNSEKVKPNSEKVESNSEK